MKEGRLVLGGAVLAAVTASICCIGPLVFALLGVGAFGAAAAALDSGRPYFLSAAALFLAFGFYRAYGRPQEACIPGEACEPSATYRASRTGLWLASLAVLAFGLWPYYAGAAIKRMSAAKAAPLPVENQIKKATFAVTGMTCGGCEPAITLVLGDARGVKGAEVSYDRSEAVVAFDPAVISVEKIRELITETGYPAELKTVEK